jgi:hypothetical protein
MRPETHKRHLASTIVGNARNHRVDANIRSWGCHARRFARRHTTAIVAAIFARCLHLHADADLMCIGEASIGNGPLNAIADPLDWKGAAEKLPAAGSQARLSAGTIEVADAVFCTAAARDWHPPPWPRMPEAAALAISLERLAGLARRRAPSESLASILFGSIKTPATAFHRIARPRVERFRRWTRARLSHPRRNPAPVDLLGLGPGLTPSGDDLLCGALVALHAIGRVDAAEDLYAAIVSTSPASTSLLSWASLRAAAGGQVGEPLHALVVGVLENRKIDRELIDLSRVGHTSGWDALAGATMVLQAIVRA